MKIKKGWLMVKDTLTNKMVPFFLKVRSEDVISTDRVYIRKVLRHTSMKWSETLVNDTPDVTVYKFTRNFSGNIGDIDSNGEEATGYVENGVLYYYLFKDGRAHIHGEVQVSNQGRDGDGTDNSTKIIDLPYSVNESFMDADDWIDNYRVEGDEYTNGPKNPIRITRADGMNSSYLGAYLTYQDIMANQLGFGNELFRLNIVDYFNKEIEYGLTEFVAQYLQNYVVEMGIVPEEKLSETTPQDLYNAARYNISIDFYWK